MHGPATQPSLAPIRRLCDAVSRLRARVVVHLALSASGAKDISEPASRCFRVLRRVLHTFKERQSLYALGLLVLLGLLYASYRYVTAPERFTIAVAPRDGVEAKMLASFADALEHRGRDIQVTIVPFDDVHQSAEALQRRKVDLAVVRPDVSLPANGLTVAILRQEGLILVAPDDELAQLENARIGVVLRHGGDLDTIRSILVPHDLLPAGASLVGVAESAVESSLESHKVDALAFIAAPSAPEAAALVRAATKVWKDKTTVLPLPEAAALALETPALSEITIPAGSLGTRPRLPADEIKTAGVSYRLMAHFGLDRSAVSELTEYLFQMRSRIAFVEPTINQMKAPDDDSSMSAALPNHPGAIDYFTREQQTFMDRYGDWIWLALFVGGGLSSALAWATQLVAGKQRRRVDEVLDRLLEILKESRCAATNAELDELATEVDELVRHAIQDTRSGNTDTRTMSTLILAVDSTRTAIFDRRRALPGEKPTVPSGGELHVVRGSISSLGS
jgi:TRAP-type uncharacterized transport system substrate-binding protein